MGKKILYGIEDYARDKLAEESAAGRTAAQRTTPRRLGLASAANGTPGGSVYIKPATVPKQMEAPTNTGTAAAVKKETVQPAVSTTASTTSADTPVTQREMMYQNVVNAINSASQNLLDVMNRQFKYDEKSSPLYSILQKQYEREAEKAAGQAYAASVANTGGYGSSYATMAGEAARRQVMAGFDDQQLALYEAAKQEFDAERQSALDWYNTAVGMRAQAAQMVEEEKLLNSARSSGMNEDTYNLMIQAANEGWYTGANKEALRARLSTYAAGNPNINVDAIMERLKAETEAVVLDRISELESEPTMSGAAEVYAAAKQAGTLERDAERISKSAKASLEKDLATDGADTEAILAEGAKAVKDGYLSEDDYVSVLTTDIHADIKEMEESDEDLKDKKKQKRIAQNIEGLFDMYEKGMITESMYNKALNEMIPYIQKYFSDNRTKFASELGGLSNGEAAAIYDVWQAMEKKNGEEIPT